MKRTGTPVGAGCSHVEGARRPAACQWAVSQKFASKQAMGGISGHSGRELMGWNGFSVQPHTTPEMLEAHLFQSKGETVP
jgi:hypothetical protein